MLFIYSVAFLTHILAIAAIILSIRTIRNTNPHWLINNLIALAVFSLIYFTGIWAITSIYFKYIYAAIMLIVILVSGTFQFAYRKTEKYKKEKANIEGKPLISKNLFFIGLLILNGLVVKGFFIPDNKAVDIEFPMKNGDYYIFQGGNSFITNAIHRRHPSQQYAFDIIKLNEKGSRAKGILPKSLDDYYIFKDTVYAPFDGEVTTVVDGMENNIPPEMNHERPLGNYVIFSADEFFILLAHFHPGSIMVKEGSHIKKGTPIGLIGNSGRSIEPHLHIQAMSNSEKGEKRFKGTGLPLKFNSKAYSLNSIIKSKK